MTVTSPFAPFAPFFDQIPEQFQRKYLKEALEPVLFSRRWVYYYQ